MQAVFEYAGDRAVDCHVAPDYDTDRERLESFYRSLGFTETGAVSTDTLMDRGIPLLRRK
jgi:hypothetical protein